MFTLVTLCKLILRKDQHVATRKIDWMLDVCTSGTGSLVDAGFSLLKVSGKFNTNSNVANTA